MKQTTDTKIAIQSAVNAFEAKSLFEAGTGLFETLGYDTTLQAPLEEKTFAEFNELYVQSSPNVERFSEERAMVEDWKSIDILFQLTDESFSAQNNLFDSKVNPYEKQSYLCFAVELLKDEYTKTQVSAITREINKLFAIPILVIFKYGKCITLAVINRRVNKRDSDRDVLEKVTLIKDIVFANPHRAHIEILFDMALENLNKTYEIHNFETLHKAWSEVLDTQTLNKRFYSELSNWYFWAIKTVVYPGYEMEADKNGLFKQEDKIREHNAKNLIRLLTRLLFVWFIKEKDLIPEELFDEKKIRAIITKFSPDYSAEETSEALEGRSIYYKAILQNLFFASLNAEHGKRAFRIDGQNQNATSLMRYKRYHKDPESFVKLIESKVPFMNGGLFECLDHADEEQKGKQGGAVIVYEDGFSDRKDNELFVPDYIFFGKNVSVDLSSEYDDKKKKDVTVNGIINILQKYKFTIAENTPVEEDIALDPELLGRVFENLLASYNPETKTNARKQTGSFYTPRAIVEYMVDESLKAYLKEKIDSALQIENVEQKLADLIAYNDKEADFSAKEKRFILECIDTCKILDPACGSGAFPMGILQKIVYVIHKLDGDNRNWKTIQADKIEDDKTLTKDEKKALIDDMNAVFDDNELDYARKLYLIENCIHGIDIQPIATQISRLRFFISLIVDQKVDESKDNFGVRPLPNLENRFVTANSLIGLDGGNVLTTDKTKELMSELQKVRHELFKAKTPKYKKALREKDKEIREELKNELVLSGFGEENAAALSSWNPYDKNKSADFFDAEWMFGIKDGFDIVIGNPPYVNANELKKSLGDKKYAELKSHFETAKGTVDFYVYFFEKGIFLLKDNGVLSYITPNKYLCANYGVAVRKYFLDNTRILKLWDVSDSNCFDAAVYPIVSTMMKTYESQNDYEFSVKTRNEHNINYDSKSLTILPENIWGFLLSDSFALVKRIIEKSDKLTNVCKINATSTAGEADKFHDYISNNKDGIKLINTGTIDPYVTLWGKRELVDKGCKYLTPYLKNDKSVLGDNRFSMYNSPKIIFAKMANCTEAFLDQNGEYSSINTNCLYDFKISPLFLLGWVHSSVFNFIYETFFDGLRMAGGYLPYSAPYLSCMYIPKMDNTTMQPIITLVDKILATKKADATSDTTALERKIDELVYKLYGLTDEEIAIVEGR